MSRVSKARRSAVDPAGRTEAIKALSVSDCVRGTSPDSTTTKPSSASTGTACCTACPVPNWGSCLTNLMASLPDTEETAASTSSAPWPVMTTADRAFNSAAVSNTWSNKGLPAKRCNTLGIRLFIRVPLPAAMTTTSSGCSSENRA